MDNRCIHVNLPVPATFPASLVGVWTSDDDTVSYRFTGDGQYERYLHLARGADACRAQFFAWSRGTARANGGRVLLVPAAAQVKSVDSCVAANNYERPGSLVSETLHYRAVTTREGAPALLLRGPASEERRFRHID